jgi:DNA ligase-1
MLAQTYDGEHRIQYPVFVQPKFNGVRALYQNGVFQSRDELPWNPKVLAHLTEALRVVFDERTILDGELYCHGMSLQEINGAVQIARTEPRADTHRIMFMIFDQVKFYTCFRARWNELRELTRGQFSSVFALARTSLMTDENAVNDLYSVLVAEGFEGIMYRIGDCPYTWPKAYWTDVRATPVGRSPYASDKNNRTWHLLKRKAWQDDEFTIVEVNEGVGKRAGMVGAFVFDCGNGYRGKVGSGLSDAEATFYLKNPPIGRRVKVKYLTLTADGVPFNPTFEELI